MTAKLLIGFHDAFRLRQWQAMLRTFEQPVYTVVDGRTDKAVEVANAYVSVLGGPGRGGSGRGGDAALVGGT